jgi:hypothetical protein
MKMTPFTEQDWMAWSGCSSNEPMIGVMNCKDTEDGVIVVRDENHVCLNFVIDDEAMYADFILTATFANEAMAQEVCDELPDNINGKDLDNLVEKYGFCEM